MAEKHLRELLREKQEPFVLENYIHERRSLFKTSLHETKLQTRAWKPLSHPHSLSTTLLKSPCFFSLFDSSDPRNSPLFDFHSPPKTPGRLSVPSKTTTLLVESALRIQNQSSSRSKCLRFGLLSSVLKRIALRRSSPKREICGKERLLSLREMLRRESLQAACAFAEGAEDALQMNELRRSISNVGSSCSCDMSDWWRALEEKSEADRDCSSCSCRSCSIDFECAEVREEEQQFKFRAFEMDFCSSPFRFRALEGTPDSVLRTPEFGSPAGSQDCMKTELESEAVESQLVVRREGAGAGEQQPQKKKLKEYCKGGAGAGDEEENEQLSPVSVLDAPFHDSQPIHDDVDDEDEDDSPRFRNSLATVNRVKHQLMTKIRRFERLAALDPLELEKRIAQDEEEEEEDCGSNLGSDDENGYDSLKSRSNVKSPVKLETDIKDEFVKKVLMPLNDRCRLHQQILTNKRRLVLDLAEEERKEGTLGGEELVKRVRKRIESWKNVVSNTVDVTVDFDFKRERQERLRNPKEVEEIAFGIEFFIFGSLVCELLNDLSR